MKIQNVAIYIRKSRPEETEADLTSQQLALIRLCDDKGWNYDIYKDNASSQDLNREEFQMLLGKVKLNVYDAIVVTDQGRLSRNTGHFGTIKETLANYGVLVVTENKIYDYNRADDDLVSDFESVISKQEYMAIKKRLIRGRIQSVKSGNWAFGKPPYGYKRNHKTKKLEKNEYAPVIERIFTLYASGVTTVEIARTFELEGVLTPRGTIWDDARISTVLSNEVYKGCVVYGKTINSRTDKYKNGRPKQLKNKEEYIIVENAHEPIIDPVIWEQCKQIRQVRNTRPPGARIGKMPFSNLIKCAICGATHSFQKRKTKTYGEQIRITSCQTKIYDENGSYSICKNKGVDLYKFEEVFYKTFSKYVDEIDQYIEVIKNSVSNDVEDVDTNSIKGQIKKIDSQIKKVQQGFVMEIFTDEEAKKQISGLKTRKEQLEQELIEASDNSHEQKVSHLEQTITNIKLVTQGSKLISNREANELFREVIERIEYQRVGDHTADINLTIYYK